MKSLTILSFLISLSTYAQNSFIGDWEMITSKYISHPFEKDTLTLIKPNTVKNEVTNEVSIITGNEKINLITITNSIDAYYTPNFFQSPDTSFLEALMSGSYEDTLVKQFNNLAFFKNERNIELIFYNNYNVLVSSPTSNEVFIKWTSNGQISLKFNYKIIIQNSEKVVLVKKLH